jgi:hypothetical protein
MLYPLAVAVSVSVSDSICLSVHPLSRDYTSPQTLRVEFGIAQEMEQLDRSFKVRQMLGAHK